MLPLIQQFLIDILESPYPPPDAMQSQLQQHVLYDRAPLLPYGEATSLICHNRDLFLGTAISWDEDAGSVWWYVLFASLRPVSLWAVKLDRFEYTSWSKMWSPQVFLNSGAVFAFSYLFAMHDDNYQDIGPLLPDDPFAIDVLPGCSFTRGSRTLAADADPTNLSQFLVDSGADLHPKKRHKSHASRVRQPHLDDDTLTAHPWLQAFVARGQHRTARRLLQRTSPRKTVGDLAASDPFVDVANALQNKQREFNELLQQKPRHFAVSVRGGRWTQINLNTPFDCVVSRPASSVAASFCEMCGVQKMHSFAFSNYGDKGSRMLAAEAATMYQHYFDVWSDSAGPEDLTLLFQANHYEESTDFVEWLRELPSSARAWARVRALRSLFGGSASRGSAD